MRSGYASLTLVVVERASAQRSKRRIDHVDSVQHLAALPCPQRRNRSIQIVPLHSHRLDRIFPSGPRVPFARMSEPQTVLIVDDEDDIRELARISLERVGGMRVLVATAKVLEELDKDALASWPVVGVLNKGELDIGRMVTIVSDALGTNPLRKTNGHD